MQHAAQTSSGDDTTPDFQSYETKGILDDLNNAANQAWNAGVNMINGGANAAAQAANQAARDASNAYDYYTSSGKRSVAGGSVLAAVSMAVVMLAL